MDVGRTLSGFPSPEFDRAELAIGNCQPSPRRMRCRPSSDRAIVTVLVNVGGCEWRRTTGDHAQLYYEHPTNEADRRRVAVERYQTGEISTNQAARVAGVSVAEWLEIARERNLTSQLSADDLAADADRARDL